MWKIKYYWNKIHRKFQNPTGMDWFNLALLLLNIFFFYTSLLTGNILGLALNGLFMYIGFKNLIS